MSTTRCVSGSASASELEEPVETSFLVVSEPADDTDEEDMLLLDDSLEGQPTTGEQLSGSQRQLTVAGPAGEVFRRDAEQGWTHRFDGVQDRYEVC